MYRPATRVLIATAVLLATSVAPVAAAPPDNYDIPESCNPVNGGKWTECTSQKGRIKQTSTPGGVVNFTANIESKFAVYEGDSKRDPLLFQENFKEHVNASIRGWKVNVEHTRRVEETECTTVTSFVYAAGQVRHDNVRSTCG